MNGDIYNVFLHIRKKCRFFVCAILLSNYGSEHFLLLTLKMVVRSNYKTIHIYLYFIARKHLWIKAIVEDIDHWYCTYSQNRNI